MRNPALLIALAVLAGGVPGVAAQDRPYEALQVTEPETLQRLGVPQHMANRYRIYARPDALAMLDRPGRDEPVSVPNPKGFGTGRTYSAVAGPEFQGWRGAGVEFIEQRSSNLACLSGSSATTATAQVPIPTGARLDLVAFWGYDNSNSRNLTMQLWEQCLTNSGPTLTFLAQEEAIGTAGDFYRVFFAGGTSALPNQTCHYQLWANFGSDCSDGLNVSLAHAAVSWIRDISPAPSTATFNDVGTGHPFFQAVEALADSGITGGCGGGNFCPNDSVTRGQMAVFLARALGLNWPEGFPD